MKMQRIQVPFDSGYENVGTGKGPPHFFRRGLKETLLSVGHEVAVAKVASKAALPTEISTMFDIVKAIVHG